MNLWLVTTGSYSDYDIVCAAPSEEIANQIAATIGSDARAESRPLYDAPPEKRSILWLTENMDSDGAPLVQSGLLPFYLFNNEEFETAETRFPDQQWTNPASASTIRAMRPGGPLQPWTVQVQTHGFEHERVRKSHAEYVARARAETMLIIAGAQEQLAAWAQ